MLKNGFGRTRGGKKATATNLAPKGAHEPRNALTGKVEGKVPLQKKKAKENTPWQGGKCKKGDGIALTTGKKDLGGQVAGKSPVGGMLSSNWLGKKGRQGGGAPGGESVRGWSRMDEKRPRGGLGNVGDEPGGGVGLLLRVRRSSSPLRSCEKKFAWNQEAGKEKVGSANEKKKTPQGTRKGTGPGNKKAYMTKKGEKGIRGRYCYGG